MLLLFYVNIFSTEVGVPIQNILYEKVRTWGILKSAICLLLATVLSIINAQGPLDQEGDTLI